MTEHERTIEMLTRCFNRQYASLPQWRRYDIELHYSKPEAAPFFVLNTGDVDSRLVGQDYTPLWWLNYGERGRMLAHTSSQSVLMCVKEDLFHDKPCECPGRDGWALQSTNAAQAS